LGEVKATEAVALESLEVSPAAAYPSARMTQPHNEFAAARVRARRPVRALAAVCLVAAGAACNKDPFATDATRVVVSTSFTAAALTGSPPLSASALLLPTREYTDPRPVLVAPEATGGDFDLALDINAAGQPVLLPASRIDRRASRQVGIQRVTTKFDSLGRAPGGTYVRDSVFTIGVGETVVVQVALSSSSSEPCVYANSAYMYTKLVVDSVRVPQRLLFVRAVTDPNCGFRSFGSGVPDE
jgi:hypothetical protein